MLLEGGTHEQRERYLPRLASGEWIASFALTEDEAGSDPSALSTMATSSSEGGYLLSGAKRFITNAPLANVFMVFARHADGPAQGRISAFLVLAESTGLGVGARDDKMGQHGAWTAEVRLDRVAVTSDALIGQAGAG